MCHSQACTNPNKLNLGVGAYRTEVRFSLHAHVLLLAAAVAAAAAARLLLVLPNAWLPEC